MKNSTLTSLGLLILIPIFFGSCKKEDSSSPPKTNNEIALIKEIKYYSGGTLYITNKFVYDTQNRLILVTETSSGSGTSASSFWFHYSPGIVETNLYSTSNLTAMTNYYLNDQGYAISIRIRGISSSGDTTDEATISNMEYSQDGFLTKIFTYNTMADTIPVITNTYTITDGNIISETIDHTGVGSTTYRYAYIPESVNTTGNSNYGMAFMGKSNKNLIQYQVKENSTDTFYYFYEYDSFKRVIKESIPLNDTYRVYLYY